MVKRVTKTAYRRRRYGRRKPLIARTPPASSVVPYITKPPLDVPTIRQNPRRFVKVYIDIITSPAGLFYLKGEDIRTALMNGPAAFKGLYYQVTQLDFWGTPAVLGATPARLHIKDYTTGVDGDDRDVGPSRPRVGLRYPEAARAVYQPKDDTLILIEGTSIPITTYSTCQCVVSAICW